MARHGFIAAPDTVYAGARALQPARVLPSSPSAREEVFWERPERLDAWPGGEAAAAEEFESTLEAALRRRLISDVPLGAFLSGGLDSSAIAALLVRGARAIR